MSTSRQDISEWFDEAKRQGATHLIVVCDTFDHDDYPVYVTESEDVSERVNHYSTNMQRVMEVYSMAKPKNAQLGETRAFHID